MDGGGWSALYTEWINAHLLIIRDGPNQMEQIKQTKLKIYVETLLALEIDIDYEKKVKLIFKHFL